MDGSDCVNVSPGAYVATTYAGGSVFDGTSLWFWMEDDNSGARSLQEMSKTDGSILRKMSIPCTGPIAIDKSNLWLGCGGSSTFLSRLRRSDGAHLGNLSIPEPPGNMIFDGTVLWVIGAGPINTLMKADPGGLFLGSVSVPGNDPKSILGAMIRVGDSLWVTNSAAPSDTSVLKLHLPDLTIQYGPRVGRDPSALVFDGNSVWVANMGDDDLMKL